MTRSRDDDPLDRSQDGSDVSEMGYEYGASGRIYGPDYREEREARQGHRKDYPVNAWSWQAYGDGDRGEGRRLVYGADPAAESHRGKGPRGYQRSDERLLEEVSGALEDAHGVDASDIEVQVQNGEVTLSGTVPDRPQKRLAEDHAERVRGVKDVHNRLRVQPQR